MTSALLPSLLMGSVFIGTIILALWCKARIRRMRWNKLKIQYAWVIEETNRNTQKAIREYFQHQSEPEEDD